jgi:hypothetical protein
MVEVNIMNKSLFVATVRSLVTGAVLITLLVTAMLPGWATHAQAAAGAAPPSAGVPALEIPAGTPAMPSARAEAAAPDPTVPLNTLILADEPTGNLDDETGAQVLDLLARLARERQRTLLMVTHSQEAAAYADHVLRLSHGQLWQER